MIEQLKLDFNKMTEIHDKIGFNYRMTNVSAAIGCAQLERLEEFLSRKRILASRYAEAFSDVNGVQFFEEPIECRSNYWLNIILLDEAWQNQRDLVLKRLNEAGLMSRPAWKPLSNLSPYRNCPRMDLSVAESLYRRLISIPSNPSLTAL